MSRYSSYVMLLYFAIGYILLFSSVWRHLICDSSCSSKRNDLFLVITCTTWIVLSWNNRRNWSIIIQKLEMCQFLCWAPLDPVINTQDLTSREWVTISLEKSFRLKWFLPFNLSWQSQPVNFSNIGYWGCEYTIYVKVIILTVHTQQSKLNILEAIEFYLFKLNVLINMILFIEMVYLTSSRKQKWSYLKSSRKYKAGSFGYRPD